MAGTCPQCQRNSLEYSEVRKAAWCLYSECRFEEEIKTYNSYISKYERPTVDEICQD